MKSKLGTTLSKHLISQQAKYPEARGELSGLLSGIITAARFISRMVNPASFIAPARAIASSPEIHIPRDTLDAAARMLSRDVSNVIVLPDIMSKADAPSRMALFQALTLPS